MGDNSLEIASEDCMPQNLISNVTQQTTRLQQFRCQLSEILTDKTDATINLIDALTANLKARSVCELSLSALYRYQYSSVYDSIDCFFKAESLPSDASRRKQQRPLCSLVVEAVLESEDNKWMQIGIDSTSIARQYARTLADKTMVYCPNPIAGNKPITIGHRYVVLCYLPQKSQKTAPPWAPPLSVRRISSLEKETSVSAQQLTSLFESQVAGIESRKCLCVVDSGLSAIEFLATAAKLPNLVTIARLRSNRVVYHSPQPEVEPPKRGHPRWYGHRFALNDQSTQAPPDQVAEMSQMTRRGKRLTICIAAWQNMRVRGNRAHQMHHFPFTLHKVTVTDESGSARFKRPIWLAVFGKNRAEVSLQEVYEAYRQRYDIEHFFRFGKQRLLLDKYQTPDVEHEENWVQIAQLAYVQLYLAASLARCLPRPWERYLPKYKTLAISVADVQRDFPRILSAIEPLPKVPKRRGKSPGRAIGDCPGRRPLSSVQKKGRQRQKSTVSLT
jgi:hypothetical protein